MSRLDHRGCDGGHHHDGSLFARRQAVHQAVVSEQHLVQLGAGVDDYEHHLTGGQLRNARRHRRTQAGALLHRLRPEVENSQALPRLQQVLRHRITHHAQTDKACIHADYLRSQVNTPVISMSP